MQIFPKSLNLLPIVAALGVAIGGGVATFVVVYYFSPRNLQVGYAPEQPVMFSHRLHGGELGIDCRYCHANVETSFEAMVPSTQSCMGCHTLVRPASARLQPVRDGWASGEPVPWVRVHNLPDHAYFDHSVHVAAGVGCATCHGRVDRMEVVRVETPLSMSWCLDCHRDPEPGLRPTSRITDMAWSQADATESERREIRGLLARALPPENCSGCHR